MGCESESSIEDAEEVSNDQAQAEHDQVRAQVREEEVARKEANRDSVSVIYLYTIEDHHCSQYAGHSAGAYTPLYYCKAE